MKLTKFQQAQLLHLHLTGQFKTKNSKGNKVSRKAWLAMIDSLVDGGFVDPFTADLTEQGENFIENNHLNISLSVLD